MQPVTLLLCATCDGAGRGEDRKAISAALVQAGLADQVTVDMVECMGACEKPVTIGLQGAGRASYVFAGVRPQQDAGDIARTCATYLAAQAGLITDARPCGRLRDCLRARLPVLASVDGD